MQHHLPYRTPHTILPLLTDYCYFISENNLDQGPFFKLPSSNGYNCFKRNLFLRVFSSAPTTLDAISVSSFPDKQCSVSRILFPLKIESLIKSSRDALSICLSLKPHYLPVWRLANAATYLFLKTPHSPLMSYQTISILFSESWNKSLIARRSCHFSFHILFMPIFSCLPHIKIY